MWILLNFAPLAALLIYLFGRRKLDPFEPVVIGMGYVALNFALSGVSVLAAPRGLQSIDYLKQMGISPDSYMFAGILETSAFVTFLLGYSLRPVSISFELDPSLNASPRLDGRRAHTLFLVAAFALLSACGGLMLVNAFSIDFSSLLSISRKRFIHLGDGEYAAALGYARWLAGMAQYALLLFLVQAYDRNRRLNILQMLVAALLFALMALPPFLTSSRYPLILSALSALVVLHYMRRPIRLRTLVAVGLLGAVTLAVMGELRSLRRGDIVDVSARGFVAELTARENAGFTLTARLVEDMPAAWGFQNGATFLAWAFAPIPRSAWPDKPAISLGQEVKVKLFDRPAELGGGVPPSSAGEFYINFGAFALFLAPIYTFLGGLASKSIYWRLVRSDRSPFSIFVYAVIFLDIAPLFFWTQFSQNMVNLAKVAVILLLTKLVLQLDFGHGGLNSKLRRGSS